VARVRKRWTQTLLEGTMIIPEGIITTPPTDWEKLGEALCPWPHDVTDRGPGRTGSA